MLWEKLGKPEKNNNSDQDAWNIWIEKMKYKHSVLCKKDRVEDSVAFVDSLRDEWDSVSFVFDLRERNALIEWIIDSEKERLKS